jgi:hypothetical protein
MTDEVRTFWDTGWKLERQNEKKRWMVQYEQACEEQRTCWEAYCKAVRNHDMFCNYRVEVSTAEARFVASVNKTKKYELRNIQRRGEENEKATN